jgi:hypothetical protein
VLPDGLTLNSATGLISGEIASTAAFADYKVTIERRNLLGAIVSQTITIKVTGASFAAWISAFNVADKTITGDSDLDGLPNLLEYALGSLPGLRDHPDPIALGRDADSVFISYSKSKAATDVALIAEWSPNLAAGSWQNAGIVNTVIVDGTTSQSIRSAVTIDATRPAKFIRLRAALLAD